jgi:hypothetical protein
MTKIVMFKYSVLTNKSLHKNFSGALREMSFKLLSWFTDWNKNKIIKVYGCSFNFLESENKNPTLSSKYQNQFISVHSPGSDYMDLSEIEQVVFKIEIELAILE